MKMKACLSHSVAMAKKWEAVTVKFEKLRSSVELHVGLASIEMASKGENRQDGAGVGD